MRLKSIFLLLCLCFCVNAFANNEPITQLWQFKMAGVNKTIVDGSGHVYVLNEYQNNMKLYAVSDDGKAKWHLDLPHQVYAQPCVDRDGNVYLYGQDASVTSVTPNGSIKWRINLPVDKADTANINLPLAAGLFTTFIYATTSNGTIFAIYSNGHAQKIYTPREQASLVAAPVEAYTDRISLTFALNFKRVLDIAEIHTVSSNKYDVEDKVIKQYRGQLEFFDMGAYSRIMYVILNEDKHKSLIELGANGDEYWRRPLASENTKLIQREDLPNYFRKIYYTDMENNESVIFGIDAMSKEVFKAAIPDSKIAALFAYKNNLLTVNQANDGKQNIIVLDRTTGNIKCASNSSSMTLGEANYFYDKVYLSSPDAVSAFETCVKD